ncbi:MAG: TIGR01777 family oxidoreductase [Phycisphaerae bacterium]|nr:TIGR01777 family oxidoreductase [Phycisphaerae bacterium]
MRILITGATGSIGRRLVPVLNARGDRVAVVTRRPRDARRLFGGDVEVIAGDCSIPGPWQQAVEGASAVVHLAGVGIADKRWSARQRTLIETSRVESTHHVVNAIEEAKERPRVLVNASATGYYGDAGEENADERFPAGKGFLADVCVRWEAEAQKAEAFGLRVVRARIGVVLDEKGPALRLMLPWFRAALGATIGNGQQRLAWIWHGDCVAALAACVDRSTLSGPVNVVAPEPCTQRAFAKALGRAVGRPVILRVPWIALRVAYGPIADELVRSAGVVPTALLADRFLFRAPTIEACMEELLHEESTREASMRSLRGRPLTPVSQRLASVVLAAGVADSAIPAVRVSKPSRPPARPRMLVVSSSLIDSILGDAQRPRLGSREAVRLASSRGCAVVIAGDARGPLLGPLLVDPLLHPLAIAANGAVLWNHREGRAIFADRVEPATLAGLSLAVRSAAPDIVLVFEGEDWIASERVDVVGFGKVDLRLTTGELPPKPSVRVHLVGSADAVKAARIAIELPFWRERKVTLFSRGTGLLSVAAPLVDRAVAAQRIARKLGATREETMALLATEDDLGLADWCGFSVAASDSPASVRRLAGAVLDASADSLGDAVRRYLAES